MSLKETVNSAKANYMVRILTQAGPGTFIPIIEKAGLLDKTNRRYTNMRHLCNTMFENDNVVEVIKGHIEEGENKVYEDLIQ
jgi:hypothetical protein